MRNTDDSTTIICIQGNHLIICMLYLSMDHAAVHDPSDYAFAWNMEILLAGSWDVAWQGYNKMDTADTPILKWDNC